LLKHENHSVQIDLFQIIERNRKELDSSFQFWKNLRFKRILTMRNDNPLLSTLSFYKKRL